MTPITVIALSVAAVWVSGLRVQSTRVSTCYDYNDEPFFPRTKVNYEFGRSMGNFIQRATGTQYVSPYEAEWEVDGWAFYYGINWGMLARSLSLMINKRSD
jgi:hypothetical protein